MENFTSNSRCPSSPEISGDLASLGPFPTGSPGSPWTRVGVCAPQFITVPIHLAWATQVVLVVKNPLTIAGDARDADLIPRLEDGSGNGNPLQYSCLENSMDRRAWQATVMGLQRVGHD